MFLWRNKKDIYLISAPILSYDANIVEEQHAVLHVELSNVWI